MKNVLKITGLFIFVSLVTFITQAFLSQYFPTNFSVVDTIITGHVLMFIIFTILITAFWCIFFRAKQQGLSFFSQIQLKKILSVLLVGFSMLTAISALAAIDRYKATSAQNSDSHFIGDTIYENSKYNFKIVYPNGSVFANANPEHGFVVRFFIPNGKTIQNDQENVGIYIDKDSENLEAEVKKIQDRFAKNGTIDIVEVQFGGQKGYRMLLSSNYSASKGARELYYLTVKNGVLYGLNYFPVTENISIVDGIANSFEFTKD